MNEQEMLAELTKTQRELDAMRRRMDLMEFENRGLPHTMLLDQSFLKRAFAVYGHSIVASLIIAVPLYILFFIFVIMIGGFGSGLFS